MRLHDRDNPAFRMLSSRGEDGADFDGVVGVVVENYGTISLADLLKRRFTPSNLFETLQNGVVPQAELEGDSDCRERVLDIVPAGHGHVHAFNGSSTGVALKYDGVETAAPRPGGTLSARRSASAEKP